MKGLGLTESVIEFFSKFGLSAQGQKIDHEVLFLDDGGSGGFGFVVEEAHDNFTVDLEDVDLLIKSDVDRASMRMGGLALYLT